MALLDVKRVKAASTETQKKQRGHPSRRRSYAASAAATASCIFTVCSGVLEGRVEATLDGFVGASGQKVVDWTPPVSEGSVGLQDDAVLVKGSDFSREVGVQLVHPSLAGLDAGVVREVGCDETPVSRSVEMYK